MLEITICDDDLSALDSTANKIKQYAQRKRILLRHRLYSSSQRLMEALQSGEKSSLYILDVEMPVFSGLELAREIRCINPEAKIIISSIYGDYGVDAVNADVSRYVLKSEPDAKLFTALDEVINMLDLEDGEILRFQRYLDIVTVNSSEVLYINKDGKYCVFHLEDDCVKQVRTPIQHVFAELPAGKFLYTDKGVVANIQKIASIENDTALLQDGTKIPVSRSRKKEILDQITAFWSSAN